MKGTNPEGKSPLFVMDKDGSISPELARTLEVQGLAYTVINESEDIRKAVMVLKNVSAGLGKDRYHDGDEGQHYTFDEENSAKEELLKIADFLTKINMRLWFVVRNLNTKVESVSQRIQIEEDTKMSEELKTFLKTDPPGFTIMQPHSEGKDDSAGKSSGH